MKGDIRGFIFDLDGVIVDTAKYHYQSWVRLAKTFGYHFRKQDNEALKGVSRMQSLEIILRLAGEKRSTAEKEIMCAQKNEWYLELIQGMTKENALPGVNRFIRNLRRRNKKVALGSASKNARTILKQIKMIHLFDAIVDGTNISKGKPDPEVFIKAAKALKVKTEECLVFEDAEKGIEAAKAAGMYTVGVGDRKILHEADLVISTFNQLTWRSIKSKLSASKQDP